MPQRSSVSLADWSGLDWIVLSKSFDQGGFGEVHFCWRASDPDRTQTYVFKRALNRTGRNEVLNAELESYKMTGFNGGHQKYPDAEENSPPQLAPSGPRRD